jgi:hypothetical protein
VLTAQELTIHRHFSDFFAAISIYRFYRIIACAAYP